MKDTDADFLRELANAGDWGMGMDQSRLIAIADRLDGMDEPEPLVEPDDERPLEKRVESVLGIVVSALLRQDSIETEDCHTLALWLIQRTMARDE